MACTAGRAGVCLTTLGPGATNTTTAVAYAHLGISSCSHMLPDMMVLIGIAACCIGMPDNSTASRAQGEAELQMLMV